MTVGVKMILMPMPIRSLLPPSQGEGDDEGDGGASAGPKLPPLPADGLEIGVLPRVIRTLVERRGVVKRMLKKEKVPIGNGVLRKYGFKLLLFPMIPYAHSTHARLLFAC